MQKGQPCYGLSVSKQCLLHNKIGRAGGMGEERQVGSVSVYDEKEMVGTKRGDPNWKGKW